MDEKATLNSAGLWLNDKLDIGLPMGSWTGLPRGIGAPLSGILWGGAAGAAYDAYRRLIQRKKVKNPWKKPLIGALAGATIGLGSLLKKSSVPDLSIVERALMADPALSAWEKRALISRLQHVDDLSLHKMAVMAAAGTLTGALASMLIGSPMGLLAGALGAAISSNNYRRNPYYV